MISARSGRSDITDILVEGEHIDLDIQENVRICNHVHVHTHIYMYKYIVFREFIFTYIHVHVHVYTGTNARTYNVAVTFYHFCTVLLDWFCGRFVTDFVYSVLRNANRMCVCVSTLHHHRALDGLLSTLQLREGK